MINGAPARRDEAESPIVTIAREALAKFRAPVWGGQITNRADLLMALSHGEGAREYDAEGRAAAESAGSGCDRTLGQGYSRQRLRERRDAQAGGIVLPHCRSDKERAVSARFSVCAAPFLESTRRRGGGGGGRQCGIKRPLRPPSACRR